jgi:hypothetical protein
VSTATRGNRVDGGNPVAVETDPNYPLDIAVGGSPIAAANPLPITTVGDDSTKAALRSEPLPWIPYNIAAAGTYAAIKSGVGTLHAIAINTPTAGTITVYDSLTATGTKIATITIAASDVPKTLLFDAAFAIGLTIVTSAGTDITALYQ